MVQPIYLDNNSSTPLDPVVLEAMLPYFLTDFGNPTNTSHALGRRAAAALECAREQVAHTVGGQPEEIVFTSGATESNNLAVLGVGRGAGEQFRHVITTAVEHSAVLEPCRQLEREGVRVTYLPVDNTGRVDPEDVDRAITTETCLVSVMAANNEVGTLQPVAEIGRLCRMRGVLFHSDAAQAVGRIPIAVDDWSVDLLSISAHKQYGPKGIGALFVRKGAAKLIAPLQFGGHQERGIRPGTPPVPPIVGLGAACDIATARLADEPARLASLGERLLSIVQQGVPSAVVHGHPTDRLPGLLSVGFPGVDGDVLLHHLGGLAVSQGSSCSAGSLAPSHVLLAMKVRETVLRSTLRLGVGRFTSPAEIEVAGSLVVEAVRHLSK